MRHNLMVRTLLAVMLGVTGATIVAADVVKVDEAALKEIAHSAGQKGTIGGLKFPKDSQIAKTATWGGSFLSSIIIAGVWFQFPRAQATRFAADAKENFVKLDSTNWRPDIFNAGILVTVDCDMSDMTSLVKMERIVCVLPGDSTVAPLWTALDTVQVSNLAGAKFVAVNLRAMFPINLFNLNQDLRFFVFSNAGRSKDTKVSAKELAKQR